MPYGLASDFAHDLLTVFTVTDKAAGQPGLRLLGDSNERLYLRFALQTLLE